MTGGDYKSSSITKSWMIVQNAIKVQTVLVVLMIILSLVFNAFQLIMYSAIVVVPGWCALLLPIGRGRIWSCRVFLVTNGIWIILSAACVMYGFKDSHNWAIPAVTGFCQAVFHSIVFLQTWTFIRQTHRVSMAVQPLLPGYSMGARPLLPLTTRTVYLNSAANQSVV